MVVRFFPPNVSRSVLNHSNTSDSENYTRCKKYEDKTQYVRFVAPFCLKYTHEQREIDTVMTAKKIQTKV